MAINNENNASKRMLPGDIPFTFRADYYFSTDPYNELYDYDNQRSDRITEISGWAVRDAGLRGKEEDDLPNPGVYLSVTISENHGITLIIPEPELLKIIAQVQQVKHKNYSILTEYRDAEGGKYSYGYDTEDDKPVALF